MSKTSLESRWPPGFLTRSSEGEAYDGDLEPRPRRARKNRGPLLIWLFILTLLSTTWVGTTAWSPVFVLATAYNDGSLKILRCLVLENGLCAILFSMSLIAILASHEMGHYWMTRAYGVASTPPIFIPFPFHPIGTCGALIAMQSGVANRKQMFDIGIAGPLAGLVVAIPVMFAGFYTQFEPNFAPRNDFSLGMPLLVQLLADSLHLPSIRSGQGLINANLNPFLMASWAGLLVTGLNMMPMSQLDGGHVAFGLLGRRSIWVAYFVFGLCVTLMIIYRQYSFALMLGLVLLLGLRHPPSSDDTVPLGWFRHVLGWISLSIPVFCIPPQPFHFLLEL